MQPFNHFPFMIIMLPMMASIVIPLTRGEKAARTLTICVQLILTFLSLLLLMALLGDPAGYFIYSMGNFPAPWGNELRAGALEAVLSGAFSAVMLFSLLGGSYDLAKDIKKDKIHLYYLMLNMLTTSLMALVYTNDIFTAYVFIEINTIAACAIIVAKENSETIKAAVKYLLMSVLGSGLFLLATSILYDITGHLLMEPAHEAITAIAASGQYRLPLLMTLIMYIVALAVKSALFPFHTWLPDAHGSATTTSSAVLSGLVLKGYIVLLIKLLYRVYGISVVNLLGVLPVLFWLGITGMIAGSIVAIAQTDIKRMIAYSSVAQIGYIFMGIGLNTTAGFTAASYQIIAHAFTKSMLFIAAGALINTMGTTHISEMTGAAKRNKIAGAAFTVGALSMIGVPLFAGFPAKFYLANAAAQGGYGAWVAMTVLALSTFLNALYYIPALIRFYADGGKRKDTASAKAESIVIPALACLIAANIALGIFYTPLLSAIEAGFSRLG